MAIVENMDVALRLKFLIFWRGDDLAVLNISDRELFQLVWLLESFDVCEFFITRFKMKLTRLIEIVFCF